jgi:hypothetical protein
VHHVRATFVLMEIKPSQKQEIARHNEYIIEDEGSIIYKLIRLV